ncbi:MAG TPA: hypothetical protein VIM20_08735, partial [Candidatus Limnocylindrales bacterium]
MPETRYAIVGDVHVAYQTVGDGPVDLVLADQWFSHMEAQWDVPPVAELRRRLASIGRLIVFDKRGVGMSDPVAIDALPSIEAWIDDLRAVLDAAGAGRAVLPAIRVPTLVIQHADATGFHPDHGRYLAAHIDGARYVELPGTDNLIWAGDQGPLVAEIEEFITGARSTAPVDRRLATVLFTDIVGSTQHASELGDRAWRDLLARHDRLASQAIEAAGGRVI